MITNSLKHKLTIITMISSGLLLTLILRASAAPSVALPATVTVEMYQLNVNNSSKFVPETPCTNANKDQYGCTALPNNSNFEYPYGNDSTPDVNIEDYVLDVIAKEMNPNVTTNPEVLRAQAIASRSYAGWYENNSSTLNNSTQRQVFAPYAFEWMTTGYASLPNQSQDCNSSRS